MLARVISVVVGVAMYHTDIMVRDGIAFVGWMLNLYMRHSGLRSGAGNLQFDIRLFRSLLAVGVGMRAKCWVLGVAVLACLFLFCRCLRWPSVGMVCDVMVYCWIGAPDRGYFSLVWGRLPSVAGLSVLYIMPAICQCLVLRGDFRTPPIVSRYDPFLSSTNKNALRLDQGLGLASLSGWRQPQKPCMYVYYMVWAMNKTGHQTKVKL